MRIRPLFLLAALFIVTATGYSESETDLSSFFSGYRGAFVLMNSRTGEVQRFNPEQCGERLSPCSTFKIANALIGLDCGVLRDADQIIQWDGIRRPIEAWNADLPLREAIAVSAVPHFQQIARRIGAGRMQDYLDKFGYGNRDISGGITRFWLGSSLKISADEQVIFLRKLLQGKLPVSDRAAAAVREILKLETGEKGVLYGKTGTQAGPSGAPVLGWFAGFVESGDSVYIFAANIRGEKAAGWKAKRMTRGILIARGLL